MQNFLAWSRILSNIDIFLPCRALDKPLTSCVTIKTVSITKSIYVKKKKKKNYYKESSGVRINCVLISSVFNYYPPPSFNETFHQVVSMCMDTCSYVVVQPY